MKLAVLGSDKLVTTMNAILTEIFTGELPDEIHVLFEDKPKTDINKIVDIVSLFKKGIKVVPNIIGEGISRWREKVSKLDIDIADVTPGRKYMAVAVYSYSKAKEVRYVYIKNEREGYRVFGYIPFSEVSVTELRTGNNIPLKPVNVLNKDPNVINKLSPDSVRALINLHSLQGDVKIRIDSDELKPEELIDYVYENSSRNLEEYRICGLRSGILRFKEENEIKEYAKRGYVILADTNVYINLGMRLRELTYSKEFGSMLLPTKAIYNELQNKTISTQKDKSLMKFYLANMSFKKLHPPPVPTDFKGIGDVALINEAKALKSELLYNIAIVTSDSGVMHSASVQVTKDIVGLHDIIKGDLEGIGEFLYCLSFYKKRIEILVNNKVTATIYGQDIISDKVEVKDNTGYALLLEKEEEFLNE